MPASCSFVTDGRAQELSKVYRWSALQNVGFGNSPVPVTGNNPATDSISVVPMRNNTVWVMDGAHMEVSVITRDKSGKFHVEGTVSYDQK